MTKPSERCADCKWYREIRHKGVGWCDWPCPTALMLPLSILESDAFVALKPSGLYRQRPWMPPEATGCPVWEKKEPTHE
jgi:hypothetical protein